MEVVNTLWWQVAGTFFGQQRFHHELLLPPGVTL